MATVSSVCGQELNAMTKLRRGARQQPCGKKPGTGRYSDIVHCPLWVSVFDVSASLLPELTITRAAREFLIPATF